MLRRLWRLRLLVAAGVFGAALIAVYLVFRVSLSPPSIRPDRTVFGAASVTVYIDTAASQLITGQEEIASLNARAQVLGRLIDSGGVRASVARALDVPVTSVTVTGPFPDTGGQPDTQPAAQQRANELLQGGNAYTIFVDTEASAPTIALSTQAPTGPEAVELADATIRALDRRIKAVAREERTAILRRVADELRVQSRRREETIRSDERRLRRERALADTTVIRRLGPATGGEIVDEAGQVVAIGIFLALSLSWCVFLLIASSAIGLIRER